MSRRLFLFNGFLALFAVMCITGCGTTEERKRKKEISTFRVHLESEPGSMDRSSAVTIYRSAPLLVGIDREPILDESHVKSAAVIEQPVGFAIEVQLDRRGSWILERTTVGYKGRHLAIFGHFGPARWLAAPEITGRNSSGRLVFSPDATREEAERFVRGLNNTAHKLERKENWPFRGPMDQ
jgi:hypothetical protein